MLLAEGTVKVEPAGNMWGVSIVLDYRQFVCARFLRIFREEPVTRERRRERTSKRESWTASIIRVHLE